VRCENILIQPIWKSEVQENTCVRAYLQKLQTPYGPYNIFMKSIPLTFGTQHLVFPYIFIHVLQIIPVDCEK
jgi:hypothetical protein